MTSEPLLTVGALADALELRFPSHWAEAWDRVGLVSGDRETPVTGILVTLDATAEAVDRAVAAGANVVVTHHPAYLDPPERVATGAGPAGALEASLAAGVALLAAHTNLDRAPDGASALSLVLGLEVLGPLESSAEDVVVVTTFAPPGALSSLRAAMADAGAGRLGDYERCAFVAEGTGYFDPLADAEPSASGGERGVGEVRLEMVATPSRMQAVLEAARSAHPYEEPVVLAVPGVRARGVARLGRVCAWRAGASLGDLAAQVSVALGVACRVWGDPSRAVERIAVANGSAGSLIGDALRSADTLVAGEVRYHDALAASANGLAIIEAGHDATEWPIVRVLADAVRDVAAGAVPVTEEDPACGWWTMEEPNVGR